MKSMRGFSLMGVMIILSMLLSACYLWADVEQNEVGAEFVDNKLVECLGPGLHTDGNFTSELKKYPTTTFSFDATDSSVATKDNQEVEVSITIQARRRGDCESVKNFYTNYSNLLDDAQLISLMSKTALEGMKVGVRSMNIYQLLDDRNKLADTVLAAIQEDSSQYSVDVIDVTINAVNPTDDFMAILNETANITAETDKELRRQELIRQQAANDILQQEQQQTVYLAQLAAEEAKTAVEVEIASREGEVIAARNSIYEENEQAYELERARILRDTVNSHAQFWFVQPGTDLNLFTSGPVPTVVPVTE